MRLFPLTLPRARALDARWRAVIHRYKGAAPSSLGIAHMGAESNGSEAPVSRDTRSSVGIMKIPTRRARKLRYFDDALSVTVNNIYVWGRLTNDDAQYLYAEYPTWWPIADIDFWLAVRLLFVLDRPAFKSLLTRVSAAGAEYRSLAGIQTWIHTQMTASERVGRYRRLDLRRISDHLDAARKVMEALDGPQYKSERHSERLIVAPGSDEIVFRTVTAVGAV